MVDLSHPNAAGLASSVPSGGPATRDAIVESVASHAEAWASAPKVYLGPTNSKLVSAAASHTLTYTPVVAFVPSFLVIDGNVAEQFTLESLTVGADPSIFSGSIPATVFSTVNYQQNGYFSGGPVSAAVPISLAGTNQSASALWFTACIGGRRLDRLAYDAGACR